MSVKIYQPIFNILFKTQYVIIHRRVRNFCGTRGRFMEHIFPQRGVGSERAGTGWLCQRWGATVKRQMKLGSLPSPSLLLTSCSAAWFLTGHGSWDPWSKKNLTTITTKLLSLDEFWNKGKGYILDNVRSHVTRPILGCTSKMEIMTFLTDQVMF